PKTHSPRSSKIRPVTMVLDIVPAMSTSALPLIVPELFWMNGRIPDRTRIASCIGNSLVASGAKTGTADASGSVDPLNKSKYPAPVWMRGEYDAVSTSTVPDNTGAVMGPRSSRLALTVERRPSITRRWRDRPWADRLY